MVAKSCTTKRRVEESLKVMGCLLPFSTGDSDFTTIHSIINHDNPLQSLQNTIHLIHHTVPKNPQQMLQQLQIVATFLGIFSHVPFSFSILKETAATSYSDYPSRCWFASSRYFSKSFYEMGLSENVVYPEKPNGFADHYPVSKWLFHWGYTPFSDIPT